MSDDDYDDELPPIAVNGLDGDACGWSMPDAGEVAAERAAAAARELAVKALRERAREEEAALAQGSSLVFLDQASSSSSEGEGITATLDALRVCSTTSLAPGRQPSLPLIAPAVLQELMEKYADCMAKGGGQLSELQHELWLSILDCVQSTAGELEDRVLLACVCICLYSQQHQHTQLLRRLLDHVATERQIDYITQELLSCIKEPYQLITTSDTIRTGTGSNGDKMANNLLCVAVWTICDCKRNGTTNLTVSELTSLLQTKWRSLPIPSQNSLLQCIGRLLAHSLRDDFEPLLDVLESLTTTQGRGPAPDKLTPLEVHYWTWASLKAFHRDQLFAARIQRPPATFFNIGVMVAASKLQLLFRKKR